VEQQDQGVLGACPSGTALVGPSDPSPAVSAIRRPSHGAFDRGFAAIGLHLAKDAANIGGVIRAAMCYDAASIALSGERIDARHIKAATNTVKGERHIPVFRGDLRALIPYAAVPVAVDLVEDAVSLHEFHHPESAFYVFGPEDGTLGREVLSWCPRKVMVPTRFCMNLAATVNVVLYDRLAKQLARAKHLEAA
jgi:tRNA(Leu) C34 or U34 (ribose-2'-O)-methylase TrmL